MGDGLRSRFSSKKVKRRRTEGTNWYESGAYRVSLLCIPPNRVVLTVHNRFSRMMLASWAMSSWDYASYDAAVEGQAMAKFLRKATAKPASEQTNTAAADHGLEREHPALHEYLTLTRHDDGQERQTATLLVFCEGGMFKVCLSDRDTSQTLWAAAETFVEALEALEACLQSPNPQWRTSAGKRQPRK